MIRLQSQRTGVVQGDVEIFSDFQSGGDMWTGQGPRERICRVTFASPFRAAPVVHVSASLMDMHQSAAHRAELVTQNITATGFDVIFRTWSDSRVARVRAAWLAIGELPFDDDWDID